LDYKFKTRIYSESSLSKNASINLNSKVLHKLLNVLRLKSGDSVKVFNNKDGEWIGKFIVGKNKQGYVLCDSLFKQSKKELGPWLIFSPIKSKRMEWLVEKATEVGVQRFFPALMERTIVKKINHERLISYCISASEQSERLSIPVLDPLRSLKEQIRFSLDSNKKILFCDEMLSSSVISNSLVKIDPENVTVLIGPEGGLKDVERKYLNEIKGAIACSLGPRVYRAETAALVALAMAQIK